MAAYAARTTIENTPLITAQKTKPKQKEPQKTAYLSENGGLGKTRSGEWAKSRTGYDRKSDRTIGRRTREREEIWKSGIKVAAPEIPDTRRDRFGIRALSNSAQHRSNATITS